MGVGIKDSYLGGAFPLNASAGTGVKDSYLGGSVPLIVSGEAPPVVSVLPIYVN